MGTHFAQIWSNPPAPEPGRTAGIVIHQLGKGKTVWVAAPIESRPEPVYAAIVTHLLRRVLPGPFAFEMDADPAVEMTLFDQPDQNRMLASLLNMREQIPVMPVNAKVRVRIPAGRRPKRVVQIPDLSEVRFDLSNKLIHFEVPDFKVIAMLAIEFA
jgi:hypothetical protein